MNSPGGQKGLAWTLMAAAGVLCLALASRSGAQADLSKALGWALLAATGVSLLLRSAGRRVVAVLVGLLAVGAGSANLHGEGHWGLLLAAVLGLAGAQVQFLLAGRWPARPSRFERDAPAGLPASDVDLWKALDAGQDPTAVEFGDSLSTRETSHAPSNQEDQ